LPLSMPLMRILLPLLMSLIPSLRHPRLCHPSCTAVGCWRSGSGAKSIPPYLTHAHDAEPAGHAAWPVRLLVQSQSRA
jgi:hypothetical protein